MRFLFNSKQWLKFLLNSRRWMWFCVILTLFLTILTLMSSPQQLPVANYKIALALLAGLAGYWLDRVLFPFASPASYLVDNWHKDPDADHENDADYPVTSEYKQVFSMAMLRQAIIIVGTMLAVCLGL